jgi:predicted nucleic acid-binding protein
LIRDIPTGTHCFVDANIFYYHLVDTPPLSDECSDFLKRLEQRDVIGSTSTVSIAEATHKVMLADAVRTHGLDRKGLVARLKREPQLLAALSEHEAVVPTVRALNIQIELITLDLLEAAAGLSAQLCLLTNDALTVAAMNKLGLTNLATNDDDFDQIAGITVWKPR